jgi:membrane-associated phospholipid phosphatase
MPSARRAFWRLVALSAVSTILTVALYGLTVGTEVGQLVGELILGGRPTAAAAGDAAAVLSSISRISLVMGTITLASFALLQRRTRLALGVVVMIIGANVTTQLAKDLVLDRIDQLDGLFYPLSNSFPSGHVTAAASVAAGLLLVVPPVLRAPTAVAASLAITSVGLSTLLLGWHRMADVVGGTLVATAWAAGVSAILVRLGGIGPVGRRTFALGRLGSRALMIVGLLFIALGGVAYVLAALDPLGVLLVLAERGGSPALFIIGAVLVTGSALLTLGALTYALRDIRLDPTADASQAAGATPTAPDHVGNDAGDAGAGGGKLSTGRPSGRR